MTSVRRVVHTAWARKDLVGAPVVSAASQVIGLFQLVLLTRGGAAGNATDAYFFLFSLSLLPSQILLVGLLYPILLSKSVENPRLVTRLRRWAPVAAAMAAAVGALWLEVVGRLTPALAPLIVLSGVNGLVAALLWSRCLALAARGEAIWLSGIFLPANICACLAILYPWEPPAARAALMVGGLAVGNSIFYLYMRLGGRGQSTQVDGLGTDAVADEASSTRGGGWFLAKGITGYASQTGTQAIALTLPGASVTVLNVMARVVASVSTTLVGAVLPRFVHASSKSVRSSSRIAWWIGAVFGSPCLLIVAVGPWLNLPYELYVVLGLAWAAAVGINAVAQRVAYRFLPPSASVLSILSSVIVITALALLAAAGKMSLPVLLIGAVAVDSLPAGFLMWSLRERTLAVVSFTLLLVATLSVLTI